MASRATQYRAVAAASFEQRAEPRHRVLEHLVGPLPVGAVVVGEQGELHALNPVAPQFFHRLTVVEQGKSRK